MHAVFNELVWKELCKCQGFRATWGDGLLLFVSDLNKLRLLLSSKNEHVCVCVCVCDVRCVHEKWWKQYIMGNITRVYCVSFFPIKSYQCLDINKGVSWVPPRWHRTVISVCFWTDFVGYKLFTLLGCSIKVWSWAFCISGLIFKHCLWLEQSNFFFF